VGRNPRISLETPELFSEALAEVHRYTEASGRDPSMIDTAMAITWYRLGEEAEDENGDRRRFTGSAEQIAEDAQGLSDAGLNHLIIAAEYTELQQSLDEMERFAKEVVPLVN
jgi:alkanesulfonate monooxygenase SsuD/methylene tetrahydromethanopterin reductase-like flavin-dependent oxidoreductase (luciferase family)